MTEKDVIVIGAGAAGLMCAAEAGKRGRSVLVLEHSEKAGKKILISGGGRCNFTNRNVTSENFISGNPHFCKSALAGYTPDDFISLVDKYKIQYHEKKLGQLFCNTSSREILSLLKSECAESGVEIITGCSVNNILYAGAAPSQSFCNSSLMIFLMNNFFFDHTGIAFKKETNPLGAKARYVSSSRSNFKKGFS